MDEIRYLLLGLILHLIVISESRVIVPRGLSDDRLSIDEGMPILLNPLEKDKKINLKRPTRNPPIEDDDFNLYDYEGVNDHHGPPSDSDYNEFDNDINKVDNNLPGTKPEKFPFDANDEELEEKPIGKDNREKPGDDDLKKTFGNEDYGIIDDDKDLESSLDEDKPILKIDDEEIGDIDSKEPDEDYGNKEHRPENEKKPDEERKDEENNPEIEDEEKPGDEKEDEDEDYKPIDKEKPDEDNEDEEKKQEPEDVEKPDKENKDEEKHEPEDEEENDEEVELDSEDEEKIDETKGDDDEGKNVPEVPVDDGDKDEVPKGIDEESLDEEDDTNIDKSIHEGEEAGFFSGGSIFDTPFFNLEQVKKYFSKLDRALGHVFRQTLDEATLLNGTYANTTEEEVEIDGKKYIVTKSVIKGADNHSSLYVESLSSKGNDTEVIKDIEIRNASHT